MIAVEGDTAILVGGTRKQGVRELVGELVRCVQAALGLTQDEQRNGGIKVLLQQPLMGHGVIGVEKSLVDLLEVGRCLRQGELIVI